MSRMFALVMFLCAPVAVQSQNADADVSKYLALIRNGQAETVKGEIPALLTKYPNNPGILYLQGLTTTEGAEAVRIYQSIVDNFPTSEWADDALYKVYQFYYSLGLYRTAEIKLTQLRKSYPGSSYLTGTGAAEMKQLPEDSAATTAPVPSRPSAEHFTLQVGAYTTAANAERQKSFFESQGYAVEVINKVKEGRSLFLVLVGTYASADEARADGAEIKKKHNVDCIVTTK
ncbi:MAG: SPOR domain-containing protein [Bacteroidota bacterium]